MPDCGQSSRPGFFERESFEVDVVVLTLTASCRPSPFLLNFPLGDRSSLKPAEVPTEGKSCLTSRNPTSKRKRAMKTLRLVPLFAAVAMNFVSAPGNAQEAHPAWAYPMNPPGFKLANDDGSIRRVPDSTAGYTLTQTRDRFAATDWHPEDHPPMPEVVAKGGNPMSLHVAGAIAQTDRVLPRTLTLWDCPTSTSFSR